MWLLIILTLTSRRVTILGSELKVLGRYKLKVDQGQFPGFPRSLLQENSEGYQPQMVKNSWQARFLTPDSRVYCGDPM